jgi:hypothetical protein
MVKRFIPFVILTMGFLLVSVSWAADGDNDFIFAYSHADGDPFANSMVRGACAGSDLDQDGLYEIIITDYDSSGMVHVYEVVGDNSITHVWSSAGSQETSNCRQVHTGDMDNDGIGEIIFIPGDGTWSATYEGGIHVYEWDGMTDNGYGTAAASIYKPNAANQNRFRAEGFDIGDVDGDGENELMIVDNTTVNANDGLFILSVDGDFQGAHTWVEEGVFLPAVRMFSAEAPSTPGWATWTEMPIMRPSSGSGITPLSTSWKPPDLMHTPSRCTSPATPPGMGSTWTTSR